MYVGPGNGGVKEALVDSLVGLIYSRTTGNLAQLAKLQALQTQFSKLGKPLHIFTVNSEGPKKIELWDPDSPIDLNREPYSMAVQREGIDPEVHKMNIWGEDYACAGSGRPGCAPSPP